MTNKAKTTSLAVAAAAASLIMTGCAMTGGSMQTASTDVHCSGVNSCKGQTACKSASNDCKGKNSCKGQGWLPKANKADCEADGGKVI